MYYSKFKQLKRYEKPIVTEYTLAPAARLLAGSEGGIAGLPGDPIEEILP